jgi:hypothetical protein
MSQRKEDIPREDILYNTESLSKNLDFILFRPGVWVVVRQKLNHHVTL